MRLKIATDVGGKFADNLRIITLGDGGFRTATDRDPAALAAAIASGKVTQMSLKPRKTNESSDCY